MKHKTMDNNKEDKKMTWREFLDVSPVLGYFFRKKDPTRKVNFNLKVMHGINKIAIIMFLLGIVFLIIKRLI